jgi:hypothetical protein
MSRKLIGAIRDYLASPVYKQTARGAKDSQNQNSDFIEKEKAMSKGYVTAVVVVALIVASVIGYHAISGCSQNNGPSATSQPVSLEKQEQDVRFVVRLSMAVILDRAKLSAEQVSDIRAFVSAANGLLATPGKPDFTAARELAGQKLPPELRLVGLATIDLVERFVPPPPTDGQIVEHQRLVAAALGSIIEAIDLYQAP